MANLPEGYKCPKCKAFNRFALWVYAHWDIYITHKCENCKHEATLRAGRVIK